MIASLTLLCAVSAPALQQFDPRQESEDLVSKGAAAVRAGDPIEGGAVLPRRGVTFPQPLEPAAPGTVLRDEEVAARGPLNFSLQGLHDRMYFDEVDGALWARGRAYKASADGDGFTYIPFLGSRASRNWPVRFEVSGATVGDEKLELAPRATVRREGHRFLLDRGAVEAVYDLELDQVEQVFHVRTGALAGDLVLTLDLETDLDVAPAAGGLRFTGPEGGVNYGAAFALDGAGGHTPIRTTLRAGSLELTVPAALVAERGGEVVIDPVLTSWGSLLILAGDALEFDVAYDRDSDQYGLAFESPYSLSDSDVYLSLLATDGTVASVAVIDFTSRDWRDPAVASMNGDDTMLVVATQTGTNWDTINARLYEVPTMTVTSSFEVAGFGVFGGSTYSNARPDVGGNATTASGGEYLVCWERTFDSDNSTVPRCVTVDSSGIVGSINLDLLPSDPEAACSSVRVSKSTGNPANVNVWNVAFAYENTATGEAEIRSAQLNAAGQLVAGPNNVLTLGTGSVLGDLAVSNAILGDAPSPTYIITYDDLLGTSDEDVRVIVCQDAVGQRDFDLTEREHGNESATQSKTSVATTRDEFIVCYAELVGSEWINFVTTLDLVEGDNLAISERRTLLGPSNTGLLNGGPAMASRFSGGFAASRQLAIAWPVEDAGGQYNPAGVHFTASNAFSPAWQYCDGVANSTGDRGFLRLEGSRSAITNKLAVASALPPGQFCLLVGADGFADIPMVGGSSGTLCLGGSLGRYNSLITAADAGGVATFPIDVTALPQGNGPAPAVPGSNFQWQLWYRDLSGGVPTSNFTNAVTILFE